MKQFGVKDKDGVAPTPKTKEELESAQKKCKEAIDTIRTQMGEIERNPNYQMTKLQTQLKVLTAHEKSLALELVSVNAKEISSSILDRLNQTAKKFGGEEVSDEALDKYAQELGKLRIDLESQLKEIKCRTSLIAIKLGIGQGAKQVKQLQEQKKMIETTLEQVNAIKDNKLEASTVARLRKEIKDMNYDEAINHVNQFLPRCKQDIKKAKTIADKNGLKALYKDISSKVKSGGKATLSKEILPNTSADLLAMLNVDPKNNLSEHLSSDTVKKLIHKWNGVNINFEMVNDTYARVVNDITIGGEKLTDIFKDNPEIQKILNESGNLVYKALFILEAFDMKLKEKGAVEDHRRMTQIKNVLQFGTVENNPSSMVASRFQEVSSKISNWSEEIKGESIKIGISKNPVQYAFEIDDKCTVTLIHKNTVDMVSHEVMEEAGDTAAITSKEEIIATGKVIVTKEGTVDRSVTIQSHKVTKK